MEVNGAFRDAADTTLIRNSVRESCRRDRLQKKCRPATDIHAGANTCCQTISSTTDSNTDTSAGTVTPLTLLIQKLAAIHAAEPALHGGRYQELLLTNRQYAFARHGDHQAILTAANNDDNAAYLQVPLPFHTTAEQATDLITGKSFLIDKNTNKIQIELEGNSAVILGITEG